MSAILVVEDDELIATALARELVKAGYEARRAGCIAAALGELPGPDLVLCDLGLPDGDGLDLISHIAERWPALPVIAVTARAGDADLLAGLGSGAVDYLVKPFALAELLARVKAQLRLAGAAASQRHRSRLLSVGNVVIDIDARTVSIGGEPVDLRPKELDLLVRLARGGGAVVARSDLIRDVWGDGWWGSTKTLDVHVSALRRRLEGPPSSSCRVVTVRGTGYRLDAGT